MIENSTSGTFLTLLLEGSKEGHVRDNSLHSIAEAKQLWAWEAFGWEAAGIGLEKRVA